MSSKDEYPSENFGNSLQLNNWILDSGPTCHMTPKILDFITVYLEDTDKHIEVVDGHHFTAEKKSSKNKNVPL